MEIVEGIKNERKHDVIKQNSRGCPASPTLFKIFL